MKMENLEFPKAVLAEMDTIQKKNRSQWKSRPGAHARHAGQDERQ
jgi:hypothetical protein